MTDHPADTTRLTEADLDRIEHGSNWREVKCHVCGKERITDPGLTQYACTCNLSEPRITPTGPTAVQRVTAELRAARSLLADLRARGYIDECGTFPPSCWYCGATLERIHRDDSDAVEYRGEHRPMPDGGRCLYVRIESV